MKKTDMSQGENENMPIYKVIKNHQEEFAIWLAYRKPPFSWQDAYKSGTKEECLAYITKKRVSDKALIIVGSRYS